MDITARITSQEPGRITRAGEQQYVFTMDAEAAAGMLKTLLQGRSLSLVIASRQNAPMHIGRSLRDRTVPIMLAPYVTSALLLICKSTCSHKLVPGRFSAGISPYQCQTIIPRDPLYRGSLGDCLSGNSPSVFRT